MGRIGKEGRGGWNQGRYQGKGAKIYFFLLILSPPQKNHIYAMLNALYIIGTGCRSMNFFQDWKKGCRSVDLGSSDE